MDYIYDIVLNFNKDYYEFFEWNSGDKLINVKKIPCYKVEDNQYLELKNNIISVNEEFITSIKNKSYIYMNNKNNYLMCLFTNGKDVFGAQFNQKGLIIKRSSLIIDEFEEVISESFSYKITKIEYNYNKKCSHSFIGRVEKEKRSIIKKYIFNNNDNIHLKYLYYEYFEEECDSTLEIKKKLLNELNSQWNDKLDKLYNIAIMLRNSS